MQPSFYTDQELAQLGLKSYGTDVFISRYARLYSPEKISLGSHVRIDDFCILSGNITIGSHVHISAYCALYGAMGITLHDYTGISAQSVIYSAIDDFSGSHLIGPMSPEGSTNVQGGPVVLERFVQIGAQCMVFPNIQIAEGSVLGAKSMLKFTPPYIRTKGTNKTESWTIYAGIPARAIKPREKGLLNYITDN